MGAQLNLLLTLSVIVDGRVSRWLGMSGSADATIR
jgi:hypothetical protein